jgi:tubulin-specific chaperone A
MATAQGKDIQRKLKIKTGTAKRFHQYYCFLIQNRLGKELESYEKEEVKQQERIDKLKRDGADEHDVKKQIEVLQDTQQMIPDTVKRLVTAQKDLEEHMVLVVKYVFYNIFLSNLLSKTLNQHKSKPQKIGAWPTPC